MTASPRLGLVGNIARRPLAVRATRALRLLNAFVTDSPPARAGADGERPVFAADWATLGLLVALASSHLLSPLDMFCP